MLTMTLHSPQVHGFFKVPVDHLSADIVLSQHFKKCVPDAHDGVVLAPDAGSIKRASQIARRLDSGLAMIDKERLSDTEVRPRALIGDVEGKTVFIIDDEISTAGSLVETVNIARSMGAKDVYVAVTHGVYTGPAIQRIAGLDVTQVASCNTVDVSQEKIEAAITALEEALKGDDIDAIKVALDKLNEASQEMGKVLYEQEAASQAGGATAADAGSKSGDDNVVDAEVVDEDGDKK